MCEYVRFDLQAYVCPWMVTYLCHVPYFHVWELYELCVGIAILRLCSCIFWWQTDSLHLCSYGLGYHILTASRAHVSSLISLSVFLDSCPASLSDLSRSTLSQDKEA